MTVCLEEEECNLFYIILEGTISLDEPTVDHRPPCYCALLLQRSRYAAFDFYHPRVASCAHIRVPRDDPRVSLCASRTSRSQAIN